MTFDEINKAIDTMNIINDLELLFNLGASIQRHNIQCKYSNKLVIFYDFIHLNLRKKKQQKIALFIYFWVSLVCFNV